MYDYMETKYRKHFADCTFKAAVVSSDTIISACSVRVLPSSRCSHHHITKIALRIDTACRLEYTWRVGTNRNIKLTYTLQVLRLIVGGFLSIIRIFDVEFSSVRAAQPVPLKITIKGFPAVEAITSSNTHYHYFGVAARGYNRPRSDT
jgi:hypothetical protein